MKRIIIYSLILVVATIGCTDLTEEVIEGIPSENYPETEEQASVSHLESYSQLKHLFDDNGYWFLTQEISSDEMVAPRRGPHWFDGGKWLQLHYHSWNDESDPVLAMWRDIYTGVQKSNKVLDYMRDAGAPPVDKIAEVETIRSYYYFMLMDNYGDIPYLTTYFYAPELPFKNHRADVFDSLVTTLENSYQYLPSISNPVYKDFASKEMAHALLAKLYLNGSVYTGNDSPEHYAKTILYCDSLIMNSALSMEDDPMAPFRVSNINSSEVIFRMAFDEVNNTGFRLHMRTLHYNHNETFGMGAGPWNGFCVVPDHFDTYEDRDARKEGYFLWGPQYTLSGAELIVDGKQLDIDYKIPYANMPSGGALSEEFLTNCGARIQKYEIYQGALENLTVNLPLFRLPDIYLMKAEAELRSTGLTQGTLDLVNEIRIRAGIDPWDLADVNLDSIYVERGRELFAEGHRRNDMIRFGKFDQPFWSKGDGKDAEDPGANAIENIFPIPLEARTTNPNLDKDPQ